MKNPGTEIAKKLLGQIEAENEKCAYWVVSAISKIASENPEMPTTYIKDIVERSMPKSHEKYQQYLRTT